MRFRPLFFRLLLPTSASLSSNRLANLQFIQFSTKKTRWKASVFHVLCPFFLLLSFKANSCFTLCKSVSAIIQPIERLSPISRRDLPVIAKLGRGKWPKNSSNLIATDLIAFWSVGLSWFFPSPILAFSYHFRATTFKQTNPTWFTTRKGVTHIRAPAPGSSKHHSNRSLERARECGWLQKEKHKDKSTQPDATHLDGHPHTPAERAQKMPEIECKQLSATFAPNPSARKMPNGRFPGAFGNPFVRPIFAAFVRPRRRSEGFVVSVGSVRTSFIVSG